jgi:hypothetical protein
MREHGEAQERDALANRTRLRGILMDREPQLSQPLDQRGLPRSSLLNSRKSST